MLVVTIPPEWSAIMKVVYYPFQGDFQDIRESASEKNFYYHHDLSCVQRRHPNFEPGDIAIQESVKANLKDSHKRLLRDIMDIQV